MREILPQLDEWQEQGEEIALATLVDTSGSSPRPAGARMCLTRSGAMAGSVSGGCVENDVFEHAIQVLDAGAAVVRRYGITDDMSVAVGLSCGGAIDVLIEPFRDDEPWRSVRAAIEAERPAALCIALGPQALVGRRLAVLGPGETSGDIDPALNSEAEAAALELMVNGGRRVLDLPLQSPPGASDSAEGGKNEGRVYVEAIAPKPRLYIVGATHTAISLCRMARELGFHVCVIDPRTPFATQERFSSANSLLLEWPQEVLDRVPLDGRAYVLSLTHDLKFDIPTLARALRSDAHYIGALGSRRTHERRLEQLRAEGFSDAEMARIHTPIGLDIGARTPEEIALSILAEMVAVRHGRAGTSLAGQNSRIHQPLEHGTVER